LRINWLLLLLLSWCGVALHVLGRMILLLHL
jgi:hypothetical protein